MNIIPSLNFCVWWPPSRKSRKEPKPWQKEIKWNFYRKYISGDPCIFKCTMDREYNGTMNGTYFVQLHLETVDFGIISVHLCAFPEFIKCSKLTIGKTNAEYRTQKVLKGIFYERNDVNLVVFWGLPWKYSLEWSLNRSKMDAGAARDDSSVQ